MFRDKNVSRVIHLLDNIILFLLGGGDVSWLRPYWLKKKKESVFSNYTSSE